MAWTGSDISRIRFPTSYRDTMVLDFPWYMHYEAMRHQTRELLAQYDLHDGNDYLTHMLADTVEFYTSSLPRSMQVMFFRSEDHMMVKLIHG